MRQVEHARFIVIASVIALFCHGGLERAELRGRAQP
jgi:hypothetical protein